MEQAAITLAREPKNAPDRSLVMVKSNADLERERIESQKKAEEQQNKPFITGLAGQIKTHWEQAKFARNTIEERMIDALRRRNGEYSPDKLAQIRQQGGSEIYMMLTSIKCRAAEAWINDILFPAGDKPWSVEPTKIPDLSPETKDSITEYVRAEAEAWQMEAQQVLPQEALQERLDQLVDQFESRMKEEAEKIAERMDGKIEDQTQEGNWKQVMKEVVKDVITFPAGIIKGPIVRKRKTLKWDQDEQGMWKPVTSVKAMVEYKRVAPFDLYPSPSSTGPDDGYLFERHRLRRSDLVAMKGVPGYNDGAIDLVLSEYGIGGLRDWLWRDQERAQLEKRPNEWLNQGDTIDAIEFWGNVSGKLLLEWGMSADKVPDLNAEYEINAWMIGNYIIRAVLNEDPLGKRLYDIASFEEIAGAFWGIGVPEIMKDLQDICNAAARSMVNNMAIGSGPQAEVHTDRVPIGEDITSMYPWKVWQTLSDPHGGSNNPAVRFHNVDNHAPELMKVYEFFSNLADEYTGIPKYTYGQAGPGSGAGGTASGLSMIMSQASRGIKAVISNLDKPIHGTIKRTFIFNMLYDDDQSIKGDLNIVPRGASSLIAKEQQMIRRNEFLAQTNNPVDIEIMGLEGRSALLRESVKSFDIPIDDVVPDRDTIIMKAKARAMALQQRQQAEQGQELDQAGNPVSGQDMALFG